MTDFVLLSGLGHAMLVVAGLLVYVMFTRIDHQRRHPSAALAWVLGIVAFPYVALPLFLLVGSRKFARPLRTLLWACMAMWVVAALFTIRDSVWLLVAGCFLYMVLIPFIEAAEQTMLQRVVPLAKLEEEVVELVDQPLLQIALVKPSWFGDAEELEHVGVFEQVVG